MAIKHHLFLVGPSGVGKSTIGKQLAEVWGCAFYDIDSIIETRTGVGIAHIFDIEGESGFRTREHQVISEYAAQAPAVIATGGGAILTQANCDIFKKIGKTLYLSAPAAVLTERVKRNNHHRPLLQVDDVEHTVTHMLAQRTPLYDTVAHWHVDTLGKSMTYLVKEITALID